MKKFLNKFVYVSLIAILGVTGSCSTDDLDPTLDQQKEEANAITMVSDLDALLKGAYNRMSSSGYYGRDYLVTNEVHTPNVFSNGNSGRFTTQAAFEQLPNGIYIWDNAYSVIAVANAIIGTDISTLDGDPKVAEHIQGQAYAIRALAHYDLLLTFGQQHVGGNLGVPYVKEFKGEDDIPSRPTVDSNVEDIIDDLQTAYDMMAGGSYPSGLINSKEFMSMYTAKALESRVAIHFGMWETARLAALAVIESEEYDIVPAADYVASFDQDGGSNSLFEIAQSDVDYPGSDRIDFIYRGSVYGDIEVIPGVLDIYEDDVLDEDGNVVDEGDVRLDILGYEGDMLRNMEKYPNIAANIIVIRYEEVVLNYVEALYELDETGMALIWLNKLAAERNIDPYENIMKDDILLERRRELIFEGLYYWDLLRTESDIEKVSTLQNISETIPYGDYRLAYPIPLSEIDANSNMEQNPGY